MMENLDKTKSRRSEDNKNAHDLQLEETLHIMEDMLSM